MPHVCSHCCDTDMPVISGCDRAVGTVKVLLWLVAHFLAEGGAVSAEPGSSRHVTRPSS